MMCPIICITLSLALIVLLGGLFLLAYSKKEALGWMSKGASYVAILFGSVVFVGGLVAMLLCSNCNSSKCGSNKQYKHHRSMEFHRDCGGSSCGENSMDKCEKSSMKEGKCSKESKACCKGEMKEVKEIKIIEKEEVKK